MILKGRVAYSKFISHSVAKVSDMRKMLKSTFENYSSAKIIAEGDICPQITLRKNL
jgi:hypothetical protein